MMGEEHPLDALHADLREMVEHAAVAEVNEQRRVAIAKHIDIARIGPDEQVRYALVSERAE